MTIEEFKQKRIAAGDSPAAVDKFIADQTGQRTPEPSVSNESVPSLSPGAPAISPSTIKGMEKAYERKVEGEQAQRTDFTEFEKRGAKGLITAGAIAGGFALGPAAFASFLPSQLAPVASVLSNAALAAGSSLGIDLVEGDYTSTEDLMRNAASAAVIDAASNMALPIIGRAGSRLFLRSSLRQGTAMSKRAQDAQELLEQENSSLSLGGMAGRSSGLATQAESFPRGSMFTSGKMQSEDDVRIETLSQLYREWSKQIATEAGPVSTGKMLQAILVGKPVKYGTEFVPEGWAKWDTTTRQGLYTKAEEFYLGKGVEVPYAEVEDLLKVLERFKDTDEIGPAYKVIQSYVPSPVPVEVAGKVQMVQPDIPLEELILAKREINELIGKSGSDAGRFKGLSGAVKRTNAVIYDTLEASSGPDAVKAFQLADTFAGTSAALKKQKFNEAIIEQLKSSPETVLAYLGDAKQMPSRLAQLENLWEFGKGGFEGQVGKANIPTFEEAVKKPLRFAILNDVFDIGTGAISEQKVWAKFNKYPTEIKQTLFGDTDIAEWQKFANAFKYMVDRKYIDRVVPRMIEGGLIATTAYQTMSGNQDAASKSALSLSVFGLLMHGLAAKSNNKKWVKMILNDFSYGPAASGFTRAMIQLETTALNEGMKLRKKDPQALDYYRSSPGNRAEAMNQIQAQTAMAQQVGGMAPFAQTGMPVGP